MFKFSAIVSAISAAAISLSLFTGLVAAFENGADGAVSAGNAPAAVVTAKA